MLMLMGAVEMNLNMKLKVDVERDIIGSLVIINILIIAAVTYFQAGGIVHLLPLHSSEWLNPLCDTFLSYCALPCEHQLVSM